uniref:Rhomboid domain-containing protein n=1 Tax=Steinernema glaseri TaxID=37863 RepID=A0A1I7ZG67_9BILA
MGRRIENRTGPLKFATMIAVFSVATPLVILGLSYFVEEVLLFDDFHLMQQCAVGFSGVLFALKVVVNTMYPEENGLLLGVFPIPGKYVCWAELVLIQMITPNASFIGHLAGILVGLLYTSGPLKAIVNGFTALLGDIPGPRATAPPRSPSPGPGTSRNGRFYGFEGTLGGRSGMNNDEAYARRWRQYTGGLTEEEQIAEALRQSRRDY